MPAVHARVMAAPRRLCSLNLGRWVLLEVELSLVLKPVLQSLRAMAADTLGVVGTATVEVDCPKLFRERLKDVFSPRQSFQFAEDGSR